MFCTMSLIIPKLLIGAGVILLLAHCGMKFHKGFHHFSDKKIEKITTHIKKKVTKELKLTDTQQVKFDAIIVNFKADAKKHHAKKKESVQKIGAQLADSSVAFTDITSGIRGEFSKMPIDKIFDYIEQFYAILDRDQQMKFRVHMSEKIAKHHGE